MKTNNNYNLKDKTMKYLLTLSLFSILLFFGCDRDSGIISPVSLDNSPVYEGSNNLKYDLIESPEYDTAEYDTLAEDRVRSYPPGADSIFISTINLPPSEIPNLRVSKVIDGQSGGEIEFDYEFVTSEGNTISIWAKLNIPNGAFDGVEEIWMIVNNEFGTISFYPHIVFNEPADFDATYTGIDLSGINPNSVDFIFQNYDGSPEQITYDEITTMISEGKLELIKAKIPHFSRYGFVN